MAGYQYYQWNTNPLNYSDVALQYDGIGNFGGGSTFQNLARSASRFAMTSRTRAELGRLARLKFGVNNDFDEYNMDKSLNGNPNFVVQLVEQLFDARAGHSSAIGNGVITQNNNEFGVYAQDDWSPTPRLTFNVGVRWDVETGMFNRNFVTPQAIRDSHHPQYLSQFYIPIDPNRYFTNGTQRKLFLGAIQPRFGFSYALDRGGENDRLRERRHLLRSSELQRDARRDVPPPVPAVHVPVPA